MATVQEAVRRLTVVSHSVGVKETARDARELGAAVDGVAVASQRAEKATQSMEGRLASIQRKYDAQFRVQMEMSKLERDLAAAQAQGLITIQRRIELLSLAAERHGLASAAVARETAAVQQQNAALAANAVQAKAAASAQNQLIAVNDNAARFRRQNLAYQMMDVGQMAALGQNPVMTFMQQGPQIAQIYAMQGGLNALWKDATAILIGLARAAGPWLAAGAAIYGVYRYIASHGREAQLAIDGATAALAAQAAPVESLSGRVSELQRITDEYAKAIRGTAKDQSIATASIIANSEREFNAKRSLLELELKRQRAAIEARKAEIAIAGLGMQREVGASVNTRMDLERQGFSDPRIGSVPFVRLPDDITGLQKTLDTLNNSAAADKVKELRAELTLAEIAVAGVEDALKTTFSQGVEVSIGRIAKETKGGANAYRDLIKNAQDRIDQMRLEEQLIGQNGVAADALRFRLQLLQDATDKGRTVDAKKLAVIDALTEAYRRQAARLAELQAMDELNFERAQFGRSASEREVYERIRAIGLDINSVEGQRVADAIRLNQRLEGQKQLLSDIGEILVDAFSRGNNLLEGLLSNAGRLGQALQQSGVFGDKAGAMINAGLGGLSAGYQSQNPIMGGLSGAMGGLSAGAAFGPPGMAIGAAIGGIAGLIGGIFGQAKKAREEAAATATAMQDLSLRMLQVSTSTDTLEGALQVFDAQARLEVARLRQAGKSAELILQTERALAVDRLAIQRDFAAKERDAALGVLRDLANGLRSFVDSIAQFRDAIRLDTNLTSLSPGQRLAEAERQYRETAARAAGGDQGAMSRIADAARNWLDEAMSYYAATSDYFAVFDEVDATLRNLQVDAGSQLSEIERQTGHLLGIETGIINVGQALASFHAADAAYQAASIALQQQQAAALAALAGSQSQQRAMPSLWDRIFNWQPGYANGGAFLGGRELTAFANGGIVSRPTLFPMANGAGLMGEAGPEAIMPLRRGRDGKLGVAANSNATNDNGTLERTMASGLSQVVAVLGQKLDSVTAELADLRSTTQRQTDEMVSMSRRKVA